MQLSQGNAPAVQKMSRGEVRREQGQYQVGESEDLLSLVECFHLSKTLLEIWSKPYERSLLVNLIVASLRLLSSGGRPHSCSAFSLLVDDTAPIIILAALCCTESSFRLTEIEAGV
ncbi:hypothetical protein TNCV_5077691 [Trichonephila clavipes]|uniref:Uncharacterized protein n=1 Tax=Trichonephila clavipes TaxID=2585209 RepID=A0A8X6RY34_TRICX|nr:hypothetical protein TNCV_5077691 [Trichonephila clavipes]